MRIAVPPRYDPNRGQGDRFAPPGKYTDRFDRLWLDKSPSGKPVARMQFTVFAPPQYDGYRARAYFVLDENDGNGLARFQNALVSLGLAGEEVKVGFKSFDGISGRCEAGW